MPSAEPVHDTAGNCLSLSGLHVFQPQPPDRYDRQYNFPEVADYGESVAEIPPEKVCPDEVALSISSQF